MFVTISMLPRRIKMLVMLLADLLLLPIALWSAVALRMGSLQPDVSSYSWLFLAVPFITIPIFIKIGLYRAVIRYLDDKILYTVFNGMTLSVLLLTGVVVMGRVSQLPRSSIIIYWVIGVGYIGASRFFARGLLRSLEKVEDGRQPVAIYGAGRAGLQTAIALKSGNEFVPVAFFDDNVELHGANVAGIRVHNPERFSSVMKDKKCRQLLIAIPSATRSRRKQIIEQFGKEDVILKTLPGLGELVDGKVSIEDIRDVGVEDLLGRDPVPPVQELISSCIKGKVVLVTGAGGSIGSELCRQILMNGPKKLVLYEQAEYALYKIEKELYKHSPSFEIVSVLGDVLKRELLERVIIQHGVQTVYHAAAYKHVPLVEANIVPGVINNVLGTKSASTAAINGKVETFVLISTDKAVRPTNVMGASKRLAELWLQGIAQDSSHVTRFCMVRFGNVLGSSGSVVPLFKEQVRAGGPVTVTHPDVTRFFMTIPEAAQLVLQASAMGKGGDVFVLDMGESVKIYDLAKKVIELSGLEVKDPKTGFGDIAIEFTGLRPGEKLYEELLIGSNVEWTSHPRIMTANESSLELPQLIAALASLQSFCDDGDEQQVLGMLKKLVPEFSPEVKRESSLSH